MKMPVWEAGHALPASVWREAVTCGDMRDRLPCGRCGAVRLSGCATTLSKAEISAARDFINGYGWDAAHGLAQGQP